MRIDVLTLFPDMFGPVLEKSILGRALDKGLFQLKYHNIRDYTENKHKKVDDTPFGGGLGMVMTCQPIFSAMEHVEAEIGKKPYTVLMSPQGSKFDQKKAVELLQKENLCIICGHYEGIDERVSEALVDEEISLGDFVLTGGEIAAMAIIDSVCRLIPGVLREEDSHSIESHSSGLLEFPQYTRPADFRGMKMPEILLSGHHENVEIWRREQAIERTLRRRPELLENVEFTKKEKKFFEKLKKQLNEEQLMASSDEKSVNFDENDEKSEMNS